jgi:hypothetical protein
MKSTKWICSLALLVGLLSCEKEVTEIGVEIQPPGDRLEVNQTDTITVRAYRLPDDSVLSSKSLYATVGQMWDPTFGYTRANFYTQWRLPANNVLFENDPVVDSVRFYVLFADPGLYGPTDEPSAFNFQMYEMNERMYSDSVYYSQKTFGFNPFPLVDTTFVPSLQDTNETGTFVPDTLVFTVPNELGQRILNGTEEELENNTAFADFFKGIHMKTNLSSEMLFFDLTDAATRVSIFYHNSEDDSLQFDLLINDNTQRVNNFYHDFSSTSLSLKPVNKEGFGEEINYVQGLGGMRVGLEFPYLESLKEEGIIINRAEFRIPIVEGSNSVWEQPPSVLVVKLDSNGIASFPLDFLEEDPLNYGGSFSETTNRYTFNLVRHVHSVVNEGAENGQLAIVISGSAVRAYRSILKGSDKAIHGSDRMKMIITYTKP